LIFFNTPTQLHFPKIVVYTEDSEDMAKVKMFQRIMYSANTFRKICNIDS